MILLDKPFVSEFLLDTLEKYEIPVIETDGVSSWISGRKTVVIPKEEAARRWKEDRALLYTNSENSIGWIERNEAFAALSERIKLFKNKVAFRTLLKEDFPEYFYQRVTAEQLPGLDIQGLPFPFIIKPATGFFSLGVYKVDRAEDWPGILVKMKNDIRNNQDIYPEEVYNASEFIIEEVIGGDEFAIDCYINDRGEPVVLNILKHVFSSDSDVGDRLYFTSRKIMEANLEPVTAFLSTLARRAALASFPMHVELRIDAHGKTVPIEVNPMRFGGWCSSPDLTWYAYGINVYEYYFSGKTPDWEKILEENDGKMNGIIVLNNTTGMEANRIGSFDYEKLVLQFENVRELRRFDHKKYSFFGMLFVTSENEDSEEIQKILHSDLKEFISIASA